MALTQDEMEAKIAALEDRISLLFQTTDTLESRFNWGLARWIGWATELRLALTVINSQIEHVGDKLPLSGQEQ